MPLTVDSILEAIQEKISGNSHLPSLLPYGAWTGEVPESIDGNDIDPPFATIELEGTDFEFSFEPFYIEKIRFSVVIFAQSDTKCLEVMEAWHNAFDWETLTFKNHTPIQTFPVHQRGPHSQPYRWKDGGLIFSGTLIYETWINREDS